MWLTSCEMSFCSFPLCSSYRMKSINSTRPLLRRFFVKVLLLTNSCRILRATGSLFWMSPSSSPEPAFSASKKYKQIFILDFKTSLKEFSACYLLIWFERGTSLRVANVFLVQSHFRLRLRSHYPQPVPPCHYKSKTNNWGTHCFRH